MVCVSLFTLPLLNLRFSFDFFFISARFLFLSLLGYRIFLDSFRSNSCSKLLPVMKYIHRRAVITYYKHSVFLPVYI